MPGVRAWVDSLAAVGLGTAVGLFAYVGTLHVLGADARDRLVVRELASRYRDDVAEAVPF